MRRRLILAFILLIVITLAGVAFIVRTRAADQIHTFIGRGGALGLETLVQDLERHYQQQSWDGVDAVMNPGRGGGQGRGASGSGGRNLQLTDQDGTLLYSPSDANVGAVLPAEALSDGIQLIVDGEVVGYLLPSETLAVPGVDFEEALVALLDEAILGAAVVAGAAALILSLILASALIRPIRNLTQTSSQLAQGHLQQRAPESGPPEIRTLAHSFNHMAASLERLETNRRAMTADIAHELRTPLAVQRINLEAMLDGVYSLDHNNLETIAAQNQLLTRLVEDLRILSLADAGQLELNRKRVDLTSLVQRAREQHVVQAEERGIALTAALPQSSLKLNLDPLRITQIINNLLQNALRHTPEGGKILLELSADERSATLHVRDTGPGIPAEVLPHLFKRFYRGEEPSGARKEGTGLGLAIARKLAQAHGGSLTGNNAPAGGAVFTLTLPLG